jgi:hypothetical protein
MFPDGTDHDMQVQSEVANCEIFPFFFLKLGQKDSPPGIEPGSSACEAAMLPLDHGDRDGKFESGVT